MTPSILHLLQGEEDHTVCVIFIKKNISVLFIVFFYRLKQMLIDIGDTVGNAVP